LQQQDVVLDSQVDDELLGAALPLATTDKHPMVCSNDLLIVDTYGNIQRLEQLVKLLDRGEAYVPRNVRRTSLPGRRTSRQTRRTRVAGNLQDNDEHRVRLMALATASAISMYHDH
jgi:hypothetical protein